MTAPVQGKKWGFTMETQRNRSCRDVPQARSCKRVGYLESGASGRHGASSTSEHFRSIGRHRIVTRAATSYVQEFERPEAARLADAARCGAFAAASAKSVHPATVGLKTSEAAA